MCVLDDLFTPEVNSNCENFTLFVVTNHFYSRNKSYFTNLEYTYWIENYSVAKKSLKKFFDSFGDALYTSIDSPDASDIINYCYDPALALTEKGIEYVAKVAIGTARNLFKQDYYKRILIFEKNIKTEVIIKLINKYSDEFTNNLTIILVLSDNDIERPKEYLKNCPNHTTIKFIQSISDENNNKVSVLNTGANDCEEFLDFFGGHCFSTCSNTPSEILINNENERTNLILKYSPVLLKYKSCLTIDEKDKIKEELNSTILGISTFNKQHPVSLSKNNLGVECLARAFRMLCYDSGQKDIMKTLELAKEVNIPIVRANALKFSHFIPETSRQDKQILLYKAGEIFKNNGIFDQEIYCKNNAFLHEFSLKTHSNMSSDFSDLYEYAKTDANGMAGMPHLINNLGVSYLFEREYDKAIDTFCEGKTYLKTGRNRIQFFALESNLLIAEILNGNIIQHNRLYEFFEKIYCQMPELCVDYLMGHYVLNALAVVASINKTLYEEITNKYNVYKLMSKALQNNMGTGSMTYQMKCLKLKYPFFDLINQVLLPPVLTEFIGERKAFTERTGFNPFIFNIWL